MGGEHQLDNLAAALAAVLLLNPPEVLKADKIGLAILNCRLPGRLQIVSHEPDIILDVGHNELAAEAVAVFLRDSKRSNVTCVLAMLEDKAVEATALALGNYCGRWICADSPGSRGQSANSLSARIKTVLPDADVKAPGDLDDAMQMAYSSVNEDETILVFGSFTTVSGAADWLQNSMQRSGSDTARITPREPGTHAETN
jgi:dihydrofolate synthase/folylpolyglutamate synthase